MKIMYNEDEVKQVLKSILFGEKFPLVITEERELIKELQQQTVLSMLGEKIEDIPFSNKAKSYCVKYVMNHYAYTHQLLYEQSLLIELMKKNKIPMAILKGSAAAVNYPTPVYRTSGDIDFIVAEKDFSSAYKIMKENGYQLLYEEDHVDHHITLKKDKIVFELHRCPGGLPKGESREVLLKQIYADLEKTEEIEIEGYRIPILPPLSNGIVLLLHIRSHLYGGLGLRQIVDWMMFADKYLDDQTWNTQFQSIFQKSGLDTLAKTVTKMCQMNLGLSPEISWCSDASASLCEQLWSYVMEKGNFGRKEGMEHKGRKFSECNNRLTFIEFMKKLQQDGKRQWKLVRRSPWLVPFAWIYRLIYYAKYVIIYRKNIREDVNIGKSRAKMIEKLS